MEKMNRAKNELVVFNKLIEYGTKLITPEICKKCGGKCCQNSGCECHPIDFAYDNAKIFSALKSGHYSISITSTNCGFLKETSSGITLNPEIILGCFDHTLYIRMRNKNRPIVDLIHFGEVEGPCCMWSQENGCELNFANRPLYGKLLHPEDSTCVAPLSREFLKESWRDYQDILLKYAKEFFTFDDFKWYMSVLHIPFYL